MICKGTIHSGCRASVTSLYLPPVQITIAVCRITSSEIGSEGVRRFDFLFAFTVRSAEQSLRVYVHLTFVEEIET
ncbi:hypothetical protein L2E82_33616 [Cichorium intybus]|uniref:Uncharacterized protein n=1 Tax=Cichorium intybus TaxID=13427 RepID=A0ACB9BKP0_CICIN|nr:hypothetical protein L2E82_33616 [Cichorium intybus]